MMENAFSIFDALALFIAMVSMAINVLIWRMFSKRIEQEQSKTLEMRHLLSALTTGTTGLGNRVMDLEKQTHTIKRDFDTMPSRGTSASFDQVEQLVEMGAGIDDLVYNCGYSQAEAELAMILHKRSDKKSFQQPTAT